MVHEVDSVQLMSRMEIYPDKTSGKLILVTIGQNIKVPLFVVMYHKISPTA